MSKKVTTTNATDTTPKTLQELMTQYPNVSLRRLVNATVEMSKADPEKFHSINYGIMLTKSKLPVVGETYDPNTTNWEALTEKLAEKGFAPTDFDWEQLNEGTSTATLSKNMDDFEVGKEVYLRRDNTKPFTIVYKTDTHVVLTLEGSSEPMAWSNNTFLINGPVFQPRSTTNKKESKEA